MGTMNYSTTVHESMTHLQHTVMDYCGLRKAAGSGQYNKNGLMQYTLLLTVQYSTVRLYESTYNAGLASEHSYIES